MAKKGKKHPHSTVEARDELKDVVGCLSCGMPMEHTQREAASEVAKLCPRCVDSDGHLKSYNEVFERLVAHHFMKEKGMSRPEAEKAALERMSELPAWRDMKPS